MFPTYFDSKARVDMTTVMSVKIICPWTESRAEDNGEDRVLRNPGPNWCRGEEKIAPPASLTVFAGSFFLHNPGALKGQTKHTGKDLPIKKQNIHVGQSITYPTFRRKW